MEFHQDFKNEFICYIFQDSIEESATTNLVEYDSVVATDNRQEETVVEKELTRKIITQAGNIVQVPLQEEMIGKYF